MKFKPALLIAAMFLMTYSCIPKSLDESPKFDTPVTFSGKTADALTLTWAAKDDKTKDDELSYKVVYSLSDNISTEADAEANGTVLLDWTLDVSTANMTALDMVTTYYVTVLVRDKKSNTALSSGSSSTLCGGKAIFLASVPGGDLRGAAANGPAGADTICAAQKPAGSSATFKAMVVDGINRRAALSGRVNWVLGPSLTYCSSDYAKRIGTTDADSFLTVPLSNSLSTTTLEVYTGLTTTWGAAPANCSAFTSSNIADVGELGIPNGIENGTTHSFISNGSGACSAPGKIYCVEQ